MFVFCGIMLYNVAAKQNKAELMNMPENDNTSVTKERKLDCTPFCPICGSDIAYLGNECICKNKDCNWHCDDCKTEIDVDFKI